MIGSGARRIITTVAVAALVVYGCGNDDDTGGSGGTGDAHDIVQMGCEQDSDCAGGRCVQGLPGGLCTSNCEGLEDCPEGTICTDTEAVGGICLFPCSSSAQCLDDVGSGYVCDEETDLVTGEDVRVCIDG